MEVDVRLRVHWQRNAVFHYEEVQSITQAKKFLIRERKMDKKFSDLKVSGGGLEYYDVTEEEWKAWYNEGNQDVYDLIEIDAAKKRGDI